MALDYPMDFKTSLKVHKTCPKCGLQRKLKYLTVLYHDGGYSTKVCRKCVMGLIHEPSWLNIHTPVVGEHHLVFLCSDGTYVREAHDVPKDLTATKRMILVQAVQGLKIVGFQDISWPVAS